MTETNNIVKVLLVEDEPSLLEAIAFKLKQRGLTVVTAKTGEEALHALATEIPTLVWMDVLLPGLSGLEVLEKIREDQRLQHLPVIMVSVSAGPEKIQHALRLQALDYIIKSDNHIDAIVDKVMGHIHSLTPHT